MLSAFTRGLRQDPTAVSAVPSQQWSNGSNEDLINRLKLVKRQMYGCAGIAILENAHCHKSMRGKKSTSSKASQSQFGVPIDTFHFSSQFPKSPHQKLHSKQQQTAGE